jgi:cellulose synthase/poly-beta-1,6-N-acetylglucosamine synthase-like glycosyltransferase
VYTYLSIITVYLLVFAIAGRLYRRSFNTDPYFKKRIAVLIPSFNEDTVIVNTVQSAVAHDYPASLFGVYVAADHTSPETVRQLAALDAQVWTMNFERSSKARSLNFLLNAIDENQYDIALVLDGDNIMSPGFMEKINHAFQHGFRCAQGHRTAKNRNTSIAVLDALSEEINNHLFRQSQRALGFSAAIIGSGMALEFKTLKEMYNKPGILDNPVCDRVVDFELLKAGIVVEFLPDAYVFDEKVAKQKVFKNQRRRWLEAQFIHLRLFFSKKEPVLHKTKNYWNKLFITLIPPRIIILACFGVVWLLCLGGEMFSVHVTGIASSWWALLFGLYALVMVISIPRRLCNWGTVKAFFYLPLVIVLYVKAAAGMKMNRKEFIHTPKSYTGS